MSSDQHATDLISLVHELADLEFRRGILHARIEWHLRLRDVAAEAVPVPPVEKPRLVPKPPKRIHGGLMAAILAHLAMHPGSTCVQMAPALSTTPENVRQSLITLVKRKQVAKQGSHYVLAESHAGSGLVAAHS